MKKHIDVFDYSGHICKTMKRGILLNTKQGDFVNSMTIGWGTLGIEWGKNVFVAYVRESRYTRELLDASGEFTVSIPLGDLDTNIIRLCGTKSGREMDKIRELSLTTVAPEVISVPGIRELPLTLECKVLFRNVQNESKLPDAIQDRFYSAINAKDYHIAYYGEIVASYIIEE